MVQRDRYLIQRNKSPVVDVAAYVRKNFKQVFLCFHYVYVSSSLMHVCALCVFLVSRTEEGFGFPGMKLNIVPTARSFLKSCLWLLNIMGSKQLDVLCFSLWVM